MPGFWKRPVCRVYSYNLDLGESYYSPQRDYLRDSNRGTAASSGSSLRLAESPGPLTYSERLARSFLEGDKDRQQRARTEAATELSAWRGRELGAGRPPLPPTRLPPKEAHVADMNRRELKETIEKSTQQAEIILNTHRDSMSRLEEEDLVRRYGTPSRGNDDIYKRIADIRMTPFRGQELEEEYKTAQHSRAKLSSLNRELEDVTRRAMTYRPAYGKTAAELARDAMNESSMSSSYKKTSKVVVDSKSY